VCSIRVINIALVVPFGRSALFTQSVGARKRAVEGKLGKRRFARGGLGKVTQADEGVRREGRRETCVSRG
jgi:hypothetical protein